MEFYELAGLLLVAAVAGWVDAVVGGGGLIQIPALMLALAGVTPATALGTNKLAAIAGTSTAAVTYARRTKVDWKLALPAAAIAAVLAGIGAAAASHIPTQYFRPAVLAFLLLVLGFVVIRPRFGTSVGQAAVAQRYRIAAVLLIGSVIGFYDGIFGPGTGTFLIMSFTVTLGLDFVQSSAMAKFVNAGTNLGALTVFAVNDQVLWGIGLAMAVCNIIGARLGSNTALKRGATFVRIVLVVVVVAMVLRLSAVYF